MYRLCIIGLGNPGSKYNNSRHNIGKDWMLDISKKFFAKFNQKLKFEAFVAESHDNKVLWIIPTNYMNDSGKTVSKILKSTNLNIKDLLVMHDDLDLDLGSVKIKEGGGHGGHKGLKDIIERTGKNNFYRIRIGISHPGIKEEVTNWVLNKFSPEEKILINHAYSSFEEVFNLLIEKKYQDIQKILHTK
tara:strand:+ start:188 stop:754 length:567 start_codon:yes stop_codon:yes gene_type:complete